MSTTCSTVIRINEELTGHPPPQVPSCVRGATATNVLRAVRRLGVRRPHQRKQQAFACRRYVDVRAVAADGAADASQVIMAFTVIPPRPAIDSKRQLVRFRAEDSSQRDAAVVDAP